MRTLYQIFFLLCLLVANTIYATPITISGRVIGSGTNLPVSEAWVTLDGHQVPANVYTNAEGLFYISEVIPNQTFTLAIRAKLYQNYVDENIIVFSEDLDLGDIMIFEWTYPARHVLAEINRDKAHISWSQTPIHDPNSPWFTHSWDELPSIYYGSPFTVIQTQEVANRFTPDQLELFGVAGALLTKVSFFAGHDGYGSGFSHTVNVYTGGSADPYDSGTLVYTHTIENEFINYFEWNVIELSEPVLIPTDEELWICLAIFHGGAAIAAMDFGPANDGYGNLTRTHMGSWHSEWQTLDTIVQHEPRYNANFMIKGFAETNTDNVAFQHFNSVTQNYSYDVYRSTEENQGDETLWTLIATGLQNTEYIDTSLSSVPYGDYRYIVKVVFPNNNISAPAVSNLAKYLADGHVYIGNPETISFSNDVPFDFYNGRSSFAQTLYLKDELQLVGNINEIEYYFFSHGDITQPVPIAIYLANVSTETHPFVSAGGNFTWLPLEHFTLVYEGLLNVDLPNGWHNIPITFDTPFDYTGQNLVIYTWKQDDIQGRWEWTNRFKGTTISSSIRTINAALSTLDDVDPANPPNPLISIQIPNIKLVFEVSENEHQPPLNLTANQVQRTVELSWQQPLTEPINYNIYKDGNLLTTTSELIFIDEAVVNDKYYTYGVTSNFQSGESEPAEITIYVLYFAPPNNLSAEFKVDNVTLQWEEPDPITSETRIAFVVYRDDQPLAPIVRSDGFNFYDFHFEYNVEYTYYVKAIYECETEQESPPSNSVVIFIDDPTDIGDGTVIPTKTELYRNFPNPFNPETTIRFSVINSGNVSIQIYNLRGQKIKTLLENNMDAGVHSVVWDGTDDSGRTVGSGVYFYQMQTTDFTDTKRMLLLK